MDRRGVEVGEEGARLSITSAPAPGLLRGRPVCKAVRVIHLALLGHLPEPLLILFILRSEKSYLPSVYRLAFLYDQNITTIWDWFHHAAGRR